MAFEQKDGTGALFKNDKKGNDKAPDYRGTAKINGETCDIAAWIKKPEGKTPFMSLVFKKKQDRIMGDEAPF